MAKIFQIIFTTDDGIKIGRLTFPVCLPTSSNVDAKKWENRRAEILGFAPSTSDFSGSKGDSMKVAHMDVLTQETCNALLEKKLDDNEKCKSF